MESIIERPDVPDYIKRTYSKALGLELIRNYGYSENYISLDTLIEKYNYEIGGKLTG